MGGLNRCTGYLLRWKKRKVFPAQLSVMGSVDHSQPHSTAAQPAKGHLDRWGSAVQKRARPQLTNSGLQLSAEKGIVVASKKPLWYSTVHSWCTDDSDQHLPATTDRAYNCTGMSETLEHPKKTKAERHMVVSLGMRQDSCNFIFSEFCGIWFCPWLDDCLTAGWQRIRGMIEDQVMTIIIFEPKHHRSFPLSLLTYACLFPRTT